MCMHLSIHVSVCACICPSMFTFVNASVHPCVCLCMYPSIHVSVCVHASVHPCVCLCACIHPSMCLSVCMHPSIHVSVCVHASVQPRVCLCACICPFMCLSVLLLHASVHPCCLSVCMNPSIHVSVCMHASIHPCVCLCACICPATCLSVCMHLSIHVSVCVCIYPSIKQNIYTSGAYGLLVLAPGEEMGGPSLFVFFKTLFTFFLSFCLFVTTIIIMGSISTTTPICVPIQPFFNFTKHFTTYFTTHFTTSYCHPPTTFFVPKRNTGKCFERHVKILRGFAKILQQLSRRRRRRSRRRRRRRRRRRVFANSGITKFEIQFLCHFLSNEAVAWMGWRYWCWKGTHLKEAAPEKKQSNFGTFPKLPWPPPPCTLDHLGALFQINIFYIIFYHPTHSEGSRVEFMRYEKWSTIMDVG